MRRLLELDCRNIVWRGREGSLDSAEDSAGRMEATSRGQFTRVVSAAFRIQLAVCMRTQSRLRVPRVGEGGLDSLAHALHSA
jgi:hypothetical protein